MYLDKDKGAPLKEGSSYFRSALRVLLICVVLGLVLFWLKVFAYNNYLGGSEFERDLEIWVAISVMLSILAPAIEKLKERCKR